MALWEVVREIENNCSRNQMRDVFFDEIETDDPLETVRNMLREDQCAELRMDSANPDSITVYADCSGMTQRFLFTKI